MAKHLIISTSVDLVRIHPEKIVYISSDGNYSTLMLCDNETRTVTMQIGQMASLINDQMGSEGRQFVRIGRSLIINLTYVHYINPAQQKLVLSDQNRVNHSLTASKDALRELKELFENGGLT